MSKTTKQNAGNREKTTNNTPEHYEHTDGKDPRKARPNINKEGAQLPPKAKEERRKPDGKRKGFK